MENRTYNTSNLTSPSSFHNEKEEVFPPYIQTCFLIAVSVMFVCGTICIFSYTSIVRRITMIVRGEKKVHPESTPHPVDEEVSSTQESTN